MAETTPLESNGQQNSNFCTEKEIRTLLLEKTSFAFDLDNTLHEFKKVSGLAASATFQHIETRFEIPLSDLKAAYLPILSQKTASAFTDGKTSDEYRKERFAALLAKFGIDADSELLNYLAQIYKSALANSLEVKDGALDLLAYLKSIGKKVAIVTEGPQDAQEWTVEQLHIKVGFLATKNFFRISKVDGLFGKVLDHLEIESSDMAFVGDSMDRDMVPAMASGIFSIHYTEGRSTFLDSTPLRIGSLETLECILRGENPVPRIQIE